MIVGDIIVMNSMIELNRLVNITLTPTTAADPNGQLRMIKASSIENGDFKYESLEKGDLKSKRDASKYFLKKGDIIFQARGNKFEAINIDKNYENLISTQIYFNLRVKNQEVINPMYLCWYLNSRISQSVFASKSNGAVLSSIPKKVLAELEVKIPEMKKQIDIVNTLESFKNEKSRTECYLEKKEILINETIIKGLEV